MQSVAPILESTQTNHHSHLPQIIQLRGFSPGWVVQLATRKNKMQRPECGFPRAGLVNLRIDLRVQCLWGLTPHGSPDGGAVYLPYEIVSPCPCRILPLNS